MSTAGLALLFAVAASPPPSDLVAVPGTARIHTAASPTSPYLMDKTLGVLAWRVVAERGDWLQVAPAKNACLSHAGGMKGLRIPLFVKKASLAAQVLVKPVTVTGSGGRVVLSPGLVAQPTPKKGRYRFEHGVFVVEAPVPSDALGTRFRHADASLPKAGGARRHWLSPGPVGIGDTRITVKKRAAVHVAGASDGRSKVTTTVRCVAFVGSVADGRLTPRKPRFGRRFLHMLGDSPNAYAEGTVLTWADGKKAGTFQGANAPARFGDRKKKGKRVCWPLRLGTSGNGVGTKICGPKPSAAYVTYMKEHSLRGGGTIRDGGSAF